MAEVDILLAAYNGEKYISEQLESLLAQTFKDIRILIRDDGSSDRTPEIIGQYAKKYPDIIEIVHDGVVCKDPAKNFFQLMKYAEADYAMFCDQDDYWLPDKIQITLDCMKRAERESPGKPVVVFTGLNVVDENLNALGKFMAMDIKESEYLSFSGLMRKNCVSGCTEMINRAVYENIGDYPGFGMYHDHWTALYACMFGTICRVPEALILYRQHGHNAVGYDGMYSPAFLGRAKKKFPWTPKGILERIADSVQDSRERFYRPKKKFELFKARYAANMHADKLQYINDIIDIFGHDRKVRFKAMIRTKYLSDRNFFDRIIHFLKYMMY